MARKPAATVAYESGEENGYEPAPSVKTAPRTRSRIQVRCPEEMHGLTVSLLIPNRYLPHLLEAYLTGAKEGSVSRRGRKLPEAVMARKLFIEALSGLSGDDEETVSEIVAQAEQAEAASIAEHKARYAA